ncbi:death-on-curing family protein [Actinomyces ruminicola]|uniref:Death-on-curing family protein n=1 Tax=Actinomyces ruminicola TaxID=332524 RepID=A0A1G9TM10_9ACTO|nr:death-on-curing family protein [Actinomyces ruminicola]
MLLELVVRNHALVDGNKRLGWLGLVVILGLNGFALDVEDDEAYALVVSVATGRIEWQQAADWLGEQAVP